MYTEKNFFRGNYEAINTKLTNTSWENLYAGTIDDSWNLFADILTRLINEHIYQCARRILVTIHKPGNKGCSQKEESKLLLSSETPNTTMKRNSHQT